MLSSWFPPSDILYSSHQLDLGCISHPLHDLPPSPSDSMSEISELFKSTSLDSFPAEPSASSSNDSLLLDSFSISPNLIFLSHLSQDRPFSREAFPSLPSRPGPPSGYTYNREADRHSLRFPSGHRLHRRFVESYQLEDELGSGGYGFVMTARHRSSGREVAVKFIIKSKVPDHAWMEDELLGPLPVEVVLLQRLSHPNIIKSLDLFEDGLYFYLVSFLIIFRLSVGHRLKNIRCKNYTVRRGQAARIQLAVWLRRHACRHQHRKGLSILSSPQHHRPLDCHLWIILV